MHALLNVCQGSRQPIYYCPIHLCRGFKNETVRALFVLCCACKIVYEVVGQGKQRSSPGQIVIAQPI